MTSPSSFNGENPQVAIEVQRTKQAKIAADAASAMARTVRLVGLWAILAAIFIAVLVTQNDISTVKWAGGSLVAVGFFGSLLFS